MTTNKNTRRVSVGALSLGGGSRVLVQSMTNTQTHDVTATLAQIHALADAGADFVRMTVNTDAAAAAVSALVAASPVPLVADIHYSVKLAIRAVESGVAKLRINPGNIGGESAVDALVDCVKAHRIPIRVGVNGGSLEKRLLVKHGGPTAEALAESALDHVRMLEKRGFTDTVISVKASDAKRTVAAYRALARVCDYPLHIGITEAGLPEDGRTLSAVGLGALLLDDIGDTIRVSLAGDPIPEIAAANDILRACGLLTDGVRMIACPTCGRCENDMSAIAREIKEKTRHIRVPIAVAVMGCVVNGPGEAREADLGVAGGASGKCALFVSGAPPRSIPIEQAVPLLLVEIDKLALKRKGGETRA